MDLKPVAVEGLDLVMTAAILLVVVTRTFDEENYIRSGQPASYGAGTDQQPHRGAAAANLGGTFQLEAGNILEDLAVGRGYLADTFEVVVALGLDIHKPHSDQQSVRTGVVYLLGWRRLVD